MRREATGDTSAPASVDAWQVWAFGAVAIGATLIRNAATVVDVDLWGHVRFGLDKIAAGGYIATDTYSYLTLGRTWFNHEWLAEVAMAAAYRAAGPAGLVALKLVIVCAVVGAVFVHATRSGVEPIRAAALTLIPTALLAPTFGTIRPQIASVLLMTVTLVVMSVSPRHARAVWVLPPVFILWVNLHGGVLAGVGVLGVWWLATLVQRRTIRLDMTGVAVVGALAAVLFGHPLGPSHIGFLLRTATVDRPAIQDWQPVAIGSAIGVVYVVVVLGTLAVVWFRRTRARWDLIVPLLLLLVAPLLATRHLQLMAVAVPILGDHLLGERAPPTDRRDRVLALVVAVAVIVPAGVAVRDAAGCISVDPAQFDVPVAAVAAMGDAAITGPVIVPFNWGEFVIWELPVLVSIDGRRETVYSDDVYRENLAFEFGTETWPDLLIRGTPGAALLPSGSPTIDGLLGMGWTELHRDSTATVLVPPGSGAVAAPQVGTPADGAGVCFPDDGASVRVMASQE